MTQELDLNALGLVDEEFTNPTDLENMPEQFSAFELPQPGRYNFKLPDTIPPALWPDGPWEKNESGVGQRLNLLLRYSKDTGFDGRLTIVSPGPYKDKRVSVRLSNVPIGSRPSKLDYLLGEGLQFTGVLASNKSYISALAGEGGAEFSAYLIYTAGNPATKERYSTRPWENKKTGKRCLAIPKGPDGKYPQEFVDETGALLRCFVDLEDFKPAA
jgi:hypothetical protein